MNIKLRLLLMSSLDAMNEICIHKHEFSDWNVGHAVWYINMNEMAKSFKIGM